MSSSISPTCTVLVPGFRLQMGFIGLIAILPFLSGCGGGADRQSAEVVQKDPVAEFEWGMTRLKRALRMTRSNNIEGLNETGQKVEYELIPPNDKNPHYTALVTVVSKTSFMPGKYLQKKKEKPEAEKESEIKDPLDLKDDYSKYIDIPGTGPQAPSAVAQKIDTPRLDNKSVFEMAYLEGRWQLAKQPEGKHEQLWFEYAFE